MTRLYRCNVLTFNKEQAELLGTSSAEEQYSDACIDLSEVNSFYADTDKDHDVTTVYLKSGQSFTLDVTFDSFFDVIKKGY